MKNIFTVLLIEDHPILLDSYEIIFNLINQKNSVLEFDVDKAMNFDSAVLKINEAKKNGGIDIVLLDIRLEESNKNLTLAGEKLGVMIKQLMPNTKIIVLTSYSDTFILNSIFKKVNPIGFLIKSNVNIQCLQDAIISVISNEPYYCCSIKKMIRKKNGISFTLDETDRKIVYELSLGTKICNMSNFVLLSKPGIEKRIKRIKENLKIESNSNRELILKAKEKGII